MKTADRKSNEPSNRMPAAEESAAQRATRPARDADASPHETAQRQRIQDMFGGAVQRVESVNSGAGVVQRATREDLERAAAGRDMTPWGGVSRKDWIQWLWFCWKDEMASWTVEELEEMLDHITPGLTPVAKPAALPAAATPPVKKEPAAKPKLAVDEAGPAEAFPALSPAKEPKDATPAPKSKKDLEQEVLASFHYKSGPSASSSAPPVDRYAGLNANLTKLAKKIEAWDTSSMDGCNATLSSGEQQTLKAWVESIETKGHNQKYVVNIGPGTGDYAGKQQFKVSGFGNVGGKAPTYHITLK